jgi:cardiolipin synthase
VAASAVPLAQPAAAPRFDLLLGAAAFWARAEADIAAARKQVLVQAMTFEGDGAGLAVAAALRDSRAADRRVLVDDYTRVVVSDRFVLSPHFLFSAPFRAEVRSTRAMFRSLRDEGIGVRTTNPIAGRLPRYGLRNHKKLIVADDVAYVGGVNFSDHNFAWHDLMLRIEAPEPASFLAEDFDSTWHSRSTLRKASVDGLSLYALDGRRNAAGFSDLLREIEGAERRIDVVSPYVSTPFIEALGAAARRDVQVELVAPLANNKPMVRHVLLDQAPRLGLRLRLVPDMFHLKGMLIDDRLLVLGSSNFDFPSYYSMEEYLALIEDPGPVQEFIERVLRPLHAQAVEPDRLRSNPWHVLRSRIILSMGRAVASHVGRSRRTAVNWVG